MKLNLKLSSQRRERGRARERFWQGLCCLLTFHGPWFYWTFHGTADEVKRPPSPHQPSLPLSWPWCRAAASKGSTLTPQRGNRVAFVWQPGLARPLGRSPPAPRLTPHQLGRPGERGERGELGLSKQRCELHGGSHRCARGKIMGLYCRSGGTTAVS